MSRYEDRLLKLVVMSDIHLLPPGQVTRELDTAPRFEKAIADLNHRYEDADLCVFAGDIADQSDPEAYQLFDRIRSASRVPQRVMLGNHDTRPVYIETAKDPMLDENGFVQGFEDIKGHRILMIDTSEPGKQSLLCERRLDWIAARLAEAREKDLKVIVLMHHNPAALQMPVDTYRLEPDDRANLLAVLQQSGADIPLIVAGHCHIATAGSWNGYPCVTINGNQHRVEPYLRGRTGQQACYSSPAQFAVVLSDGENCTVHFHNYVDDSVEMDPALFPYKLNQPFEVMD